jgi:hypothetical protein
LVGSALDGSAGGTGEEVESACCAEGSAGLSASADAEASCLGLVEASTPDGEGEGSLSDRDFRGVEGSMIEADASISSVSGNTGDAAGALGCETIVVSEDASPFMGRSVNSSLATTHTDSSGVQAQGDVVDSTTVAGSAVCIFRRDAVLADETDCAKEGRCRRFLLESNPSPCPCETSSLPACGRFLMRDHRDGFSA